jgi:hypothetical protein
LSWFADLSTFESNLDIFILTRASFSVYKYLLTSDFCKNKDAKSVFQLLGVSYLVKYSTMSAKLGSQYTANGFSEKQIQEFQEELPTFNLPDYIVSPSDHKKFFFFLIGAKRNIEEFDTRNNYDKDVEDIKFGHNGNTYKWLNSHDDYDPKVIIQRKFLNNTGKNSNLSLFDKICKDFSNYRGTKLGSGTYGTAYDLKNFDDFYSKKNRR